MITLGVDEVGRGPWAGPMTVGAVILGDDFEQKIGTENFVAIRDSKKISKKRRTELAYLIKENAVAAETGWVNVGEIDTLGLQNALKLAVARAVEKVKVPFEQIVIDGNVMLINDKRAITMIKADDKVKAVAAASILAKVARDTYMEKLGEKYPDYGFENHAGYGTAKHRKAIEDLGVIKGVHRLSFKPVRKILGEEIKQESKVDGTVGRIAEYNAVSYLMTHEHEVLEQNWKTKMCEIDIISKLDDKIFFHEVKYRKSDRNGDGLAAITPAKLKQMKFAAEIWRKNHKWNGEMQLTAISMTGNPPIITDYILIED